MLAKNFNDTRYVRPYLVITSLHAAISERTAISLRRLMEACRRVNANAVIRISHKPVIQQLKKLQVIAAKATNVVIVTINTMALALKELRHHELAASLKDLSNQAMPASTLPADVHDGIAANHYFQLPQPMPTSLPDLEHVDLGRKKYGLIARYCNNRNSAWHQLDNAIPLKLEVPQFKSWCTDLMVLDKARPSVQNDTFDSILSNVSLYLGFVHAYFNVPFCYLSMRLFTNLNYLLHFLGFKWSSQSNAQGPQSFLNVLYRSRQALEFLAARDPAVKPGTTQVCGCVSHAMCGAVMTTHTHMHAPYAPAYAVCGCCLCTCMKLDAADACACAGRNNFCSAGILGALGSQGANRLP